MTEWDPDDNRWQEQWRKLMKEKYLDKHAQGMHDQKTHGRRGFSGRNASEIKGRMMTSATMDRLYSNYNPPEDGKEALAGYQESDFFPINQGLRSGEPPSQQVQDMDKLFETAPQLSDDTTYEYFRVTESGVFDGLKEGDNFVDQGFTSASIDSETAWEFGEQSMYDARVRIVDSGNRNKVWVDAITGREGMSQGEIVFQRGTAFRYLGQDDNGYYVLETGGNT